MKLQILCVMWKTYWHFGDWCTVEKLRPPYVLLTTFWHWGFQCTVKNMLSPCVSLKDIWDCVYCEKLAVTLCTVKNLLTSWFSMYCGITFCHRVFRQQTFDIVCTMENFRLPCVLWKTCGHRVYCGKLAVTVCIVNRHFVYCGIHSVIVCTVKSWGHRVIR